MAGTFEVKRYRLGDNPDRLWQSGRVSTSPAPAPGTHVVIMAGPELCTTIRCLFGLHAGRINSPVATAAVTSPPLLPPPSLPPPPLSHGCKLHGPAKVLDGVYLSPEAGPPNCEV